MTQLLQLRPYPHPGKFEGGLIIDQALHELVQASYFDGDCGTDGGSWHALFQGPLRTSGPFADISATTRLNLQLTPDECQFLATRAGAILTEDAQGFVTVIWFAPDQADAMEAQWQALCEAASEAISSSEETL